MDSHKNSEVNSSEISTIGNLPISQWLTIIGKFIDALPNPVYLKDGNGFYLLCNRAFELFYGIDRKEILNKCICDITDKELSKLCIIKENEVMEFGGETLYDWKAKNRMGELRDIIFKNEAILDDQGKSVALMGFMTDMTERKAYEEALYQADYKFRLFVENSSDVVYSISPDGYFTFISDAVKEYGYDPEEMMGTNFLLYLMEEDRGKFQAQIENSVKGDFMHSFIVRTYSKDGEIIIFEHSGFVFWDDYGKPVQRLGILKDSTHKLSKQSSTIEESIKVDAEHLVFEEMKKISILVIDDDFPSRTIVVKFANNRGWSVQEAENGNCAMDLFSKNKYDIIILDLQMPDISGFEVARKIRNLEKNSGEYTTIIAMTAHDLDCDVKKCFESGMDHYISKPFELLELEKLIKLAVKKTHANTKVVIEKDKFTFV